MATHANPLLPLAAPKRTGRVDYGFLLYFGLHMAGFLATTLLMTWGLFVLFFLVLGPVARWDDAPPPEHDQSLSGGRI